MPAGLKVKQIFGMKWVSVFPQNPRLHGLPNLNAVILLSSLKNGLPIAFMEGSLCSNLRTGAVGALGARHFSKENSNVIGFIGSGEQAKAHFLAMMHVRPRLSVCKVASRTSQNELVFIEQMQKYYPSVEFIACKGDYRKAAEHSDIIVTAISAQEPILQPDWINSGAFYCHVGGIEDDFGVAKKADKIVVDNWNVVKKRSQTISVMYKEGLLGDDDIYADLHEVICGTKSGRECDEEFIYFNSVGLSFLDVAVANWMYEQTVNKGFGQFVNMKSESMFEWFRFRN